MKIIKFLCLCLITVTFVNTGQSQNNNETQIVVIEKTTDNNGNVVTNKVIKTGAEAEKYMKDKKKELGIDVQLDGDTKTIRKEIKVEVNDEKSNESKHIKIKVLDDEGNEKELEWNGEGEMPEEMKKYIDEENMDIDVVETEDGQVRVKVMNTHKPRLGILPENHVDGVEVLEVISGSLAEKAGLQKDDVILKINDQAVGSTIQLKDRLNKIDAGAEATIHYLRNGERKVTTINL